MVGRIRGMRTGLKPGGFSISATACPHWWRPSIARQDSPRWSRTISSAKTFGPGSKRCRYGLDISSFSVRALLLSLSVIGSDNGNLARSLTARERQIHTSSICCWQLFRGLACGSIHRHKPRTKQCNPFWVKGLRQWSTPLSDRRPAAIPWVLNCPTMPAILGGLTKSVTAGSSYNRRNGQGRKHRRSHLERGAATDNQKASRSLQEAPSLALRRRSCCHCCGRRLVAVRSSR